MSQNGSMPGGISQLPYYREYVDQILKPKVARIIDGVRASLSERVWHEVLEEMAREQGAGTDPQALDQLRDLLEQGLHLRMTAHVVADFDGAGYAPAANNAAGMDAEPRANAEVIDQAFPSNPLARAVGGIRRVSR